MWRLFLVSGVRNLKPGLLLDQAAVKVSLFRSRSFPGSGISRFDDALICPVRLFQYLPCEWDGFDDHTVLTSNVRVWPQLIGTHRYHTKPKWNNPATPKDVSCLLEAFRFHRSRCRLPRLFLAPPLIERYKALPKTPTRHFTSPTLLSKTSILQTLTRGGLSAFILALYRVVI